MTGMGIGTLNANMDNSLARKLRLSSVPAIIGVIAGKLYWFSKPFNQQNLRDFVRSLVPSNLITEVCLLSFFRFIYVNFMQIRLTYVFMNILILYIIIVFRQ